MHHGRWKKTTFLKRTTFNEAILTSTDMDMSLSSKTKQSNTDVVSSFIPRLSPC